MQLSTATHSHGPGIWQRIGVSLLAIAGSFTASSSARAKEVGQRKGFYLHVGVGGAGVSMARKGSIGAGGPAYFLGNSHIEGGGGAFELSVGGAVTPGFVLSGVFSSQQIASARLEQEGAPARGLTGPLTFVLLGVAIDWFPAARGDFHVGAAAAIAGAWVKSPQPAFTEYLGGAGGALSAHVGYLHRVSDSWSLGLLLRLTGARLHGEDTQLGITGSEDDDVRSAALLVAACFN